MIKRLFISLFTVSLLAGLPAVGETVRIKYVTVNHLPVSGQTFHGYRSFRFDITNGSKARSADVTITLMSYNNSSVSKTARVEPGDISHVVLYQPDMGNKPIRNVRVHVRGVDTKDMYIGGNIQHGSFTRRRDQTCLLFSKNYKTEGFTDAAAKAIDPRRFGGGTTGHYISGGNQKPVVAIRAEDPVDTWIPDWLAYSPYDAVAISMDEYDSVRMHPVGNALRAYTLGGGTLHIFGAAKDATEITGLGRRFFHAEKTPTDLSSRKMKILYTNLRQYAQFWCYKDDTSSLHRHFPILDNLELPFRPFLITMFVFAILMGPVAVFILARINRRIWLLWIIPLFSGCTAACVYLFSIASEGSDSTTLARGVVFLDQPTRTGVSINRVAYYSPRGVGALRYPTNTEVAFQNQDWGYRGRGNVDWANEQLLTDGWIQSRIPAYFQTRSAGPTRERIKVTRDKGKVIVLNGLSVDLTGFYVNLDGEKWQNQALIAAGQQAELTAAGVSGGSSALHSSGIESIRNIFSMSSGTVSDMDSRKKYIERTRLPVNFYCGITAKPYLVHNGLDPERPVKGFTLLYGKLD